MTQAPSTSTNEFAARKLYVPLMTCFYSALRKLNTENHSLSGGFWGPGAPVFVDTDHIGKVGPGSSYKWGEITPTV